MCTLKNEEAFYILIYIEGTKMRKNSKCTPISKCTGNPELQTQHEKIPQTTEQNLIKSMLHLTWFLH